MEFQLSKRKLELTFINSQKNNDLKVVIFTNEKWDTEIQRAEINLALI